MPRLWENWRRNLLRTHRNIRENRMRSRSFLNSPTKGVTVMKHRPVARLHKKVGSAASKRGGASSVRNRRHRVAWTGVENEIPITVRFSEKTSMGKKIRFKVAPADVLMLVRW